MGWPCMCVRVRVLSFVQLRESVRYVCANACVGTCRYLCVHVIPRCARAWQVGCRSVLGVRRGWLMSMD